MRAHLALLLAVAAAAACACACGPRGGAGLTVSGRLVDAETGRPVPRTSIYVHAFDDATRRQVTLGPDDDDAFELTTTWPRVRLRVADTSNEYRVDERRLTVEGAAWNGTIRLVPTHRVRVHGRVLWRDGARLRPPSEGDGNVSHVSVHFGRSGAALPAPDGSFAVRLPREVLEVRTVDTNRKAGPRTLDLTAVDGDDLALDVILE